MSHIDLRSVSISMKLGGESGPLMKLSPHTVFLVAEIARFTSTPALSTRSEANFILAALMALDAE
ncbi:hypothetical protein ACQZ63_23670 [Agrobacterium sp. CG160-95]